MVGKNNLINQELMDLRLEVGLLQKTNCSSQENKEFSNKIKAGDALSDRVYQYMLEGQPVDEFYKIYDTELKGTQKIEYIMLKQYKLIKTIKNCVVFFTTITILSILVYMFIMFS